jgi:hypothetical protein
MQLQVPFVQLPLSFDADVLAAEIDALGEAPWRPHPQGFVGNSALPFIAAHGDPASESTAGPMRPTPYLERCPYLHQVLASLGSVIGRTRLMRLSGHAEASAHIDINYYWRERMRVHVPVTTQPTVQFYCGDAVLNMKPGECWIFDTWRRHRVVNDAVKPRIHLVVDTVGGDRFWQLLAKGRAHDANTPDWKAERIGPAREELPPLQLESVNLPLVMSPWELRDHVGFVLSEALPNPRLAPVHQACGEFIRRWQALWATWGESREGWPAYRVALDEFERELRRSGMQLPLKNQGGVFETIQALVLKVALSDRQATAEYEPREPVASAGGAGAAPAVHAVRDRVFDRPVFVLSPPRSGSTLLFETLARAPALYTLGGENHALLEGIPQLQPRMRGFDSNRLDVTDAKPEIVRDLRQRFFEELKDRDGRSAVGEQVRMLEKTPKNALRIPFLREAFPEARFVYLYRDVRQCLSSMLDAWRSGRFVTYPNLPGWQPLKWSMVLVPGWRDLVGKPLHEVVAAQWAQTTRLLLDDLEALPREQVCVARYDRLLQEPDAEIRRICTAMQLDWDRPIEGALPLAQHTLSAPDPDKWKRNAQEIDAILPALGDLVARAEAFSRR